MINLLVIDDDESYIQLLSSSLNKTEFILQTASTGAKGLDIAKKEKTDFILLDEILPDLPGNEILRLFKSDPELKKIPISILSDYSDLGMKQAALNNGAIEYLLKYELDMKILGSKIKQLLNSSSINTQNPTG